jgi:hypothetical protein
MLRKKIKTIFGITCLFFLCCCNNRKIELTKKISHKITLETSINLLYNILPFIFKTN